MNMVEDKSAVIGEWLKNGRQEKGLTLQDVATLTNGECSVSYISRLEQNTRKNPSIDKLKILARVLGLNINDILSNVRENELTELDRVNKWLTDAVSSLKQLMCDTREVGKLINEVSDETIKQELLYLNKSMQIQQVELLKETAYLKVLSANE